MIGDSIHPNTLLKQEGLQLAEASFRNYVDREDVDWLILILTFIQSHRLWYKQTWQSKINSQWRFHGKLLEIPLPVTKLHFPSHIWWHQRKRCENQLRTKRNAICYSGVHRWVLHYSFTLSMSETCAKSPSVCPAPVPTSPGQCNGRRSACSRGVCRAKLFEQWEWRDLQTAHWLFVQGYSGSNMLNSGHPVLLYEPAATGSRNLIAEIYNQQKVRLSRDLL